jgi:leucyl aminopeptidase
MVLGNYQFLKYKTDSKDKVNTLKSINIISEKLDAKEIDEINIINDATLKARTLVNEPVCYLNAKMLSSEIEKMLKETTVKTEVMNKAKIVALKMGGLLAVNKGSIDPPTFTILEWKPQKAVNKYPLIFVGKGVVFDTGGLNIKTGKNMDDMKCDMSGAAAVAGTLYAIAKLKLNVHVIGLIPATDNRPGGNAYVPGDVIKMYNGKTVEIMSTDAEGRLILADALSYAQKYKPELVIDIASLTGAAHAAIGKYGIVGMGAKSEKEMEQLKQCGNNVYERIAEFPFWEEYDELIKSNIADIKNLGGPYAGAITAGKFLHHFVDYPWIHLDIAGPCYNDSNDSYRGSAGTGVGVRLFVDFIKNKSKTKL